MGRVKFNVSAEYAYLENFKILSNTFRKHHVDRPIPVEQLVKCKMQDNLEFLQWTKKYWDQYYPGGDYDAVGRRKGQGAAPLPPTGSRTSTGAGAARRPVGGAAAAPRASSRQAGGPATAALQQKNAELVETVQGLERERDFYFSKLRDIELLIQQAMEADPSLEEDEGSLLKQIQTILYSTEVSFSARASQPFFRYAKTSYRRASRFPKVARKPLSRKRHSRRADADVPSRSPRYLVSIRSYNAYHHAVSAACGTGYNAFDLREV